MHRTIPMGAAILLAFVRKTEVGRDDRASYDVIYRNRQNRLAKPLTAMTYGEIVDAQKGWSKANGSSAAGGYQFMRATLIDLAKENPSLRGDDLFDPNLQDQLGFALLLRRGFERFMAGKISRADFGLALAKEWASFPVLVDCQGDKRPVRRGQSYYAGDGLNKALVSPEKVEAVLDQVKSASRPAADVPVIEKPVVADPGELGTPVTKSKTFWTWLLTAIGAPFAAFGGLDWRVQLVIVAVIVGFAIYGIKRRADLAKAVRALKAEFET